MCGRFININRTNRLNKIFDIVESNKLTTDEISYNIAPSQNVNIIQFTDKPFIESVNWGIIFLDKRDNQIHRIINSRIETVQDKYIFKESYLKRKCLIPANGYYEWKKENGHKKPFFIQVPNLETIYFAGLWKISKIDDFNKKTFTILTKQANNFIQKIHHRMPIILDINEGLKYLNNDNDQTLNINFKSELEKHLEYYQVSNFVNNPKNNYIKCIEFSKG